jgi:hypothetical protein
VAETADLYLGLVHYPVYNKHMQVVTTAVTNFDIHDIARSCATYNAKKYYIVHPLAVQREIVAKILDFWQNGYGKIYNPDRNQALKTVELAQDIKSAAQDITAIAGCPPITVTTGAGECAGAISCAELRAIAQTATSPLFLLFGTGWGIEKSAMSGFDYILQPIKGASPYNHLSVRSAAAIVLDRLAGEKWWANE